MREGGGGGGSEQVGVAGAVTVPVFIQEGSLTHHCPFLLLFRVRHRLRGGRWRGAGRPHIYDWPRASAGISR